MKQKEVGRKTSKILLELLVIFKVFAYLSKYRKERLNISAEVEGETEKEGAFGEDS